MTASRNYVYVISEILYRLEVLDEPYESFGTTMLMYVDKSGNMKKASVDSDGKLRVYK